MNTAGQWFYFNRYGYAVTGAQTINGQRLYFNNDGSQVKGQFVVDSYRRIRYYDPNSGEQAFNKYVRAANGDLYYFDQTGYGRLVSNRYNSYNENDASPRNPYQTQNWYGRGRTTSRHYYRYHHRYHHRRY